jgi:hypothetical protein
MSQYDRIKSTIETNPDLSGLFREATAAVHEYVRTNRPAWQAQKEQLRADAVTAGKQAWGVPFHPETLVVERPQALQAFLIARLGLRGIGTDVSSLAEGIRQLRDEYKGPAPAP